MSLSQSNRFVPYFNVYFKVYFFGGLTFQLILLIVILTKSPPSLRNLKVFLLNTCILQIVLISLAFFTQHRSLPNSVSLAILPFGPCRNFGPNGVSLCVGLGISNTVLYRHRALQSGRASRKSVFVMIAITYIPSIAIIIIPFTSSWNFSEVEAITYFEHPTYDLSIYEPFVGFSNIYSFQFISATLLLVIGAYGIPCISGLFTSRVIQLINANRHMSPKTKEQSKTLAYGLGCQTFLPLVCYIPIPTTYIISQILNVEMLLTEHLLAVLICLPSFLDPFISFYFIVPYRFAIFNLFTFRRQRKMTVSVKHISKQVPTNLESN